DIRLVIVAAALCTAAVLAVTASPLLALAVGIGLVIAYAAVNNPIVALLVLLAVQVSGASNVVGSHAGLSPYLVALALAVVSVALAVLRDGIDLGRSPMYLLIALLVVAFAISLIASSIQGVALSTSVERIKDVAFFFTVLAALRVTRRYGIAAAVIVAVVAALAGLTVVQQYVLHNSTTFGGFAKIPIGLDVGAATVRHSGPEADVNFWGRTIVLFFPLAAVLAVYTRGRWRWGWAAAAAALAGGEYLTQSRGGMLAFGIEAVLLLVVLVHRHRKVLLFVPVVAVGLAFVPGISSRLGSLTELTHPTSSTTDPSLVGRLAAEQIGLAMFEDHPVTGIGAGNFETVEPQYIRRPGITNPGMIIAPHNLYLEIAAEQGILGLTAWALFYAGAVFVALRAALLARRLANHEWYLIASATAVALAGWAAASLVLHLADFRNLLALVAIATALDIECRAAAASLPPDLLAAPPRLRQRSVGVHRHPARAVLAGATVAAVGAGGVALLVTFNPVHERMYAATATAEVRPPQSGLSGNNAYAWDTIDRQLLLPTFAAIADQPSLTAPAVHALGLAPAATRGLALHASGDQSSAVLTMTARALSPGVAVAAAGAALNSARGYFASITSAYEVAPVSTSASRQVNVRDTAAIVEASCAGAGVAALTFAAAALAWAGPSRR
ncbi:MAG TPA: O-antigen ligase family protein, partial [Thermoleophilia bacterium]|nr:O-antigen ligase family protein [Thermoleophilia bacterium]